MRVLFLLVILLPLTIAYSQSSLRADEDSLSLPFEKSPQWYSDPRPQKQLPAGDTLQKTQAQHIVGLSFSYALSQIPTASFELFKTKISYANFIKPNFQLSGGLTLYKASSNFNGFDRPFMFNIDLLSKFYWRKFHVDLGFHPGNYAEFIQDLDSRPDMILYTSIGGGITWPIFKKLTVDLECRKLFSVNRFPKYEGPNPFEAFIGLNYIIDGSNDRFKRTKAKIKVATILNENSHLVGYGFSAGAFNWPTNEGVPMTYMLHNVSYQYFLKRNWSVLGTVLSSFVASEAETINGLDKKNLNTLNLELGSRYQLGAFFAGGSLSFGSYSAFADFYATDRKARFYLNPEIGVNLKITQSILFEFQTRYAISLNHLMNTNDPSIGYLLGTVGIKVKLSGFMERLK